MFDELEAFPFGVLSNKVAKIVAGIILVEYNLLYISDNPTRCGFPVLGMA